MGGSGRLSRGFTLVETLAVMGIALTLVAFVSPFLARVKENTRAATCASQLKQIATGTIDYTVHHRVYPVYGLWPVEHDAGTEVYAVAERADNSGWSRFDRRMLLCPSDEQPSVLPIENAKGEIEWWPISYGFNIALGSKGIRPSSLTNPAQTLFFYDGDPTGLVADPDVDGGVKVRDNNGHGNNDDGVDSSNPGKGGKKIDTSTWDDETMTFFGTFTHVELLGEFGSVRGYADQMFRKRHAVRPLIGNVVYADGHVEAREQFDDLRILP